MWYHQNSTASDTTVSTIPNLLSISTRPVTSFSIIGLTSDISASRPSAASFGLIAARPSVSSRPDQMLAEELRDFKVYRGQRAAVEPRRIVHQVTDQACH